MNLVCHKNKQCNYPVNALFESLLCQSYALQKSQIDFLAVYRAGEIVANGALFVLEMSDKTLTTQNESPLPFQYPVPMF